MSTLVLVCESVRVHATPDFDMWLQSVRHEKAGLVGDTFFVALMTRLPVGAGLGAASGCTRSENGRDDPSVSWLLAVPGFVVSSCWQSAAETTSHVQLSVRACIAQLWLLPSYCSRVLADSS